MVDSFSQALRVLNDGRLFCSRSPVTCLLDGRRFRSFYGDNDCDRETFISAPGGRRPANALFAQRRLSVARRSISPCSFAGLLCSSIFEIRVMNASVPLFACACCFKTYRQPYGLHSQASGVCSSS